MKSLNHLSNYLDRLIPSVRFIRFIVSVVGAFLTAVGAYFRSADPPLGRDEQIFSFLVSQSDTLFWVGLAIMLLAQFLLVFIDRQAVDILKSLFEQEAKTNQINESLEQSETERRTMLAWITLTRLVSELIDQAISAKNIDANFEKKIYETLVEFVAEYKSRLFGMGDEYVNISVYKFNNILDGLVCIGCYRSRPSDIHSTHRTWMDGEGHVGKAFNLKSELICADATAPDVAPWIAAPQAKSDPKDKDKYVSLAAIPIAIDSDDPLGVFIVTSSQPYRFVNVNDLPLDVGRSVDLQQVKFAVAALQDIAAQIAQLMYIIDTKKKVGEGNCDDKITHGSTYTDE